MCNDPSDPVDGCPDFVIKRPDQTAHVLPPEIRVKSLDEMLDDPDAPSQRKDPPPWGVIGGCAGAIVVICAATLLILRAMRPAPEPLYHSRAAKVVAEDTFVEPQGDSKLAAEVAKHGASAGNFGVVKPRPHALVTFLEATKRRVPRAVQFGWSHQADEQIPKVDPETGDIYYLEEVEDGSDTKSGSRTRSRSKSIYGESRQPSKPEPVMKVATFGSWNMEKKERTLPGQLPGQLTDLEEKTRPPGSPKPRKKPEDKGPIPTAQGMALALPETESGPSNQSKLFSNKPVAVGPHTQRELKFGVTVGAPPVQTGRPAAAMRYQRSQEGVPQTSGAMALAVCT